MPAPFQKDVEQLRNRIHLDAAPWFQPEEPVPFLPLLQEAVWQEKRVRLDYRRGDGQWIKRLIAPYGLVAKASIWYVVVDLNGRYWVYRVSRIQAAEMTDSVFDRNPTFNLADFWTKWSQRFERGQAKLSVTLQVTPPGIPQMVQLFGDGLYHLFEKADSENGRLTFSLTFASEVDACQQLMGLGTAVTVISPASLRQKIAETSQKLLTLYAE